MVKRGESITGLTKTNGSPYWLLLIIIGAATIIVGGILFGSIEVSKRFSGVQEKENVGVQQKGSFKPLKDAPTKETLSNLPPRYTAIQGIEGPPYPITGCTIIENGGDYYLANDIFNEDYYYGVCVSILTDEEVTIDCRGHKFVGLNDPEFGDQCIGPVGGYDAPLTVKNCRFDYWFQPLTLGNNRSNSINNTFYGNYYGIVVGSWSNPKGITGIEIKDNIIYDTFSNEMTFHGVSQANVINNQICAPPGGFYGPYNVYCDEASREGVTGNSQFEASNCPNIQKQYCVRRREVEEPLI